MGAFCFVDDFGLALSSQINRGFTFNYNKLRDDLSEFSVERWIEKVSEQIDNWTIGGFFPVVVINTDRIAENASEFEKTFEVPFSGFQARKTRRCILALSHSASRSTKSMRNWQGSRILLF